MGCSCRSVDLQSAHRFQETEALLSTHLLQTRCASQIGPTRLWSQQRPDPDPIGDEVVVVVSAAPCGQHPYDDASRQLNLPEKHKKQVTRVFSLCSPRCTSS